MIALSGVKKPFSFARFEFWVCLFLTVMILTVYFGVVNHAYINLDDNLYVYGNRHVQSGLTRESVAWSFNFEEKGKTYWHPLTWLSHMLDVQLYGIDSGRHHLTNVFFHILNSLLLFLALHRMTGARWRAAFVAALFAVHPMNVESVAWIAARKNVLSTFFWMLSLLAYANFARRPDLWRYILVCFAFALGLLAKPMLVTLPFVFVLLDYWPLKRIVFHRSEAKTSIWDAFRLILEKIPLLILAAISVYISSISLRLAGNVILLQSVPLKLRLENAIVSYVKYMAKMLWPEHLAVFYPYPAAVPPWQTTAALIFIVGLSIWVLREHKRHAYLGVGWFWFIGTLVPVSGLVQAGLWPALADRWAYVPLVGLFIMFAWGGSEIIGRWQPGRYLRAISAISAVGCFTVISHIQVGHWASSISLFEQAVKVTDGNWVAHNNLGKALFDSGKSSEATDHYSAALSYNPNSAHTHLNFGSALLARGNIDEAVDHFQQALKLDPNFAEADNNLGLVKVRRGHIEDAVYFFRSALQKNPAHTNARQNLNLALSIQEKINRAVRRMQQALDLNAETSGLGLKLITLSERKKELIEALKYFQTALSKQPGFIKLEAHHISVVSTLMKKYESLLPLLLETSNHLPASAEARYHIACIYARKGQVQKAKKWLSQARSLDPQRWAFYKIDPDLTSVISKTLSDIQ